MNKLIFDRTSQDLLNNTDKAYYNATDLNRVEEWCEYLSNLLNGYNYQNVVNVKTDWNMYDMPTSSELERIRSNVQTLKSAYFSFTSLPENLEYMDIHKANDIEKILDEIDKIITNMERRFIYCGVANLGQSRTWQHRFRKLKIFDAEHLAIGRYPATDTISMIATDNGKHIDAFTRIDKKDDVYAGICAINSAMEYLDEVIGGVSSD